MLKRRNRALADLAGTLRVYAENVDEEPALPEGAFAQKDVLLALVAFIEGC
jgi:hypothetical protein